MSASMTLDTTRFDQAIVEYAEATHKTVADAANRFLNQIAIEGLGVARRAQDADIDGLRSRAWWIRFIAKIAGARRMAKDQSRYAKRVARFESRRAAGLRARAPKFSRRTGTREKWSRDMATAGKDVIRARKSHVNFLRLFFMRMSEEIRNRVSLSGMGAARLPARIDGGFSVKFREATPENPSAYIAVMHDYRKRSAATAYGTEQQLQGPLLEAGDLALADMVQYTQRRMIDDAAKRMATGRV